MALGDGAGLVAEEDIQRPCGLDALRLPYQHIVVQHLAGVLHQHQGNHQRQALGHRADNDYNGQRHRFHKVLDDLCPAGGQIGAEPAGRDHKVAQIHHRDHRGADVAEAGDHVGQLGQLDLQRGVGLVVLHLLRHFSHHGLQAHLLNVHHALAVEEHRPPEQGMLVHKGVSRDLVGQVELPFGGGFFALLRLAVQGGVVHPQGAVDQNAVRRHLVARLKQNLVPNHHVVHINHRDHTVAVGLALVLFGAVLQLPVLGVAGHAGLCRDKGDDENGHNGAHRLIDIRVVEYPHDDHQDSDGQ